MSPQASATGAVDKGVIDLVQDGHTRWVVEAEGEKRVAVLYTVAPLKRVEHPLMIWVAKAEVVRLGTEAEVGVEAILRAPEAQVGWTAEDVEEEGIKEQLRSALQ